MSRKHKKPQAKPAPDAVQQPKVDRPVFITLGQHLHAFTDDNAARLARIEYIHQNPEARWHPLTQFSRAESVSQFGEEKTARAGDGQAVKVLPRQEAQR